MRVAVRVDARGSLTTVYAYYTGNNSVLNSIAPNTKWGLFSRVVGRIANVFSLLDGFQKLSQVVRNIKLGLPYQGLMVAGSLLIVGAVVGLLTASFVGAVVGVLIALVGLILGAIFATLVPPAVIMWLNRSYFRNEGVGDLLPFDNLEEEKNSLEMVFKGITVEFVVGYTTVDMQDPDMFTRITYSMGYVATGSMMNSQPQEPAWDIDIKIEFPNFDKGRLDVSLKSLSDEEKDIFKVSINKPENGSEHAISDRSSREHGIAVLANSPVFEIDKKDKKSKLLVDHSIRLSECSRPFQLSVVFSDFGYLGVDNDVEDSFEV